MTAQAHYGGHDDFEQEPVRGLPQALPPGERVLWQGAPDWKALALGPFGLKLVLIWFTAMAAWGVSTGMADGYSFAESLKALVPQAVMALLAAGLLGFIAWCQAKATVYTITNRRVAMRINLAMTVTLNLPFRWIGNVAYRPNGRTGDISLQLSGKDRIAWFVLWPHSRPWRFANAEPTLRAVPDAEKAAGILVDALRAYAVENGVTVETASVGDAHPGVLVPAE